jgi:hypothetical protein
MTITVGTDFAAYRRLREPQFATRPLYPMFDVNSSFIDASNGFWIAGFNASGELVHTQAILKLNLDGMTLGQHLQAHRQKYVTPQITKDPNDARLAVPDAVGQVSGSVCYHGEFWIQGGVEGFRRQGYTALLSRLIFELAYQSWNPDFIFGLVPAAVALKGIGVRYGYFHGEPAFWRDQMNEKLAEEWVVWMGNRDIASLTQRPSDRSAIQGGGPRTDLSNLTHLNTPVRLEAEMAV